MFHAPRPHYHHRRRGRNDQGANISPMVIMLCMKVWQAYQDSPVKPPVRRSETWGTGTILLVEDEDMVRAVAERALVRQGYTVLTASDGEQGLEVLAGDSAVLGV